MSAIRSQVRNSKLMTQRSRQVMQARRLKALQWAVALALGTSVCGSACHARGSFARGFGAGRAVAGRGRAAGTDTRRDRIAARLGGRRGRLAARRPEAAGAPGRPGGGRRERHGRHAQEPAGPLESGAGQRRCRSVAGHQFQRRPAPGPGQHPAAARRGRRRHAGLGGRQARAGASAGGATLNVKPGDTLYAIAQRNAVPGASIYQMLVALWRANPQAFIQSNMNLLKAGQKLSIPDADAVRAIDPAEARRIFNEHAEAFANTARAWRGGGRESHRGQGQSAASGTVSRSGDTGAASAASAQDRLRLSNGQDGGQAQADAQGDAKASAGHAMADAQARVTTLQGNVDALNKAVGEQGAAGQAGATGAGGAAGSAGVAARARRRRWLCGCCGLDGAAGAAGSGGAAGAAGTAGSAAAAGGAGAAGSTGATGAAGAAGSTAATGAAGSAGTTARQAPRVRVLLRERRASRVLRLPSAPLRVRPRPPLPALRHQKARALRTRSRPICWPARRPG